MISSMLPSMNLKPYNSISLARAGIEPVSACAIGLLSRRVTLWATTKLSVNRLRAYINIHVQIEFKAIYINASIYACIKQRKILKHVLSSSRLEANISFNHLIKWFVTFNFIFQLSISFCTILTKFLYKFVHLINDFWANNEL